MDEEEKQASGVPLMRKNSSFSSQMILEINQVGKDVTTSALRKVYNAIFNSVKEISQHLRYSTGKPP